MSTFLKVDGRSQAAKAFLEFVKSLPFVSIEKLEDTSPYDSDFVKKVKKAQKEKGRNMETPEKLWDSLK